MKVFGWVSNLGEESSASEQSAEVFCLEQTKFVKTKTEDTFNESEARRVSPKKQKITIKYEK